MAIVGQFLFGLLLLGDLLGHDKGEDLEVDQEGNPEHIEHEVEAENSQERFIEMN